jgi:hypothetical protein
MAGKASFRWIREGGISVPFVAMPSATMVGTTAARLEGMVSSVLLVHTRDMVVEESEGRLAGDVQIAGSDGSLPEAIDSKARRIATFSALARRTAASCSTERNLSSVSSVSATLSW